jgi:hypothetical protein
MVMVGCYGKRRYRHREDAEQSRLAVGVPHVVSYFDAFCDSWHNGGSITPEWARERATAARILRDAMSEAARQQLAEQWAQIDRTNRRAKRQRNSAPPRAITQQLVGDDVAAKLRQLGLLDPQTRTGDDDRREC